MKNWQQIIPNQLFRFLDHSDKEIFELEPYTALTSFAIDDALALSVGGNLAAPAIRLWVHKQTIVLGMPDTRLADLDKGVQFLKNLGYQIIVRSSGGLAVALNSGILNISLILPAKNLSIYDGYEAIISFVETMLADLTTEIKAYEIVGSFCPGDYDLSIDGKKFAGISQRRVKDGAAIQIYLDVSGNTRREAKVIREFYTISGGDQTKTIDVIPETMASLSELLNREITVEEMRELALKALIKLTHRIPESNLTNQEIESYHLRSLQMHKRNAEIKQMQINSDLSSS